MKNDNYYIKCDVNELFKVLSLDILIIYFGSSMNMEYIIMYVLIRLFVFNTIHK